MAKKCFCMDESGAAMQKPLCMYINPSHNSHFVPKISPMLRDTQDTSLHFGSDFCCIVCQNSAAQKSNILNHQKSKSPKFHAQFQAFLQTFGCHFCTVFPEKLCSQCQNEHCNIIVRHKTCTDNGIQLSSANLWLWSPEHDSSSAVSPRMN